MSSTIPCSDIQNVKHLFCTVRVFFSFTRRTLIVRCRPCRRQILSCGAWSGSAKNCHSMTSNLPIVPIVKVNAAVSGNETGMNELSVSIPRRNFRVYKNCKKNHVEIVTEWLAMFYMMSMCLHADTCKKMTLTQPCRRDGYQDPRNCRRCRCPDGFGGQFCEHVKEPKNGK